MNTTRKAIAGAALIASALAGGAIGATIIGTAGADTTTTAPTATAPQPGTPQQGAAQPPQFDPTKGGHVGQNGTKEELLTGDTASKVKAAALAAVPGGTVERVETDAEGSPYEAHMTKADGTHVTVKVDKDFKVTTVETDRGPGGPGGPGGHRGGPAPAATTPSA